MKLALIASLAALVYPLVLRLGVDVSVVFVLVSLVVPILGVVAITRVDTPRRARAIAHLVVAAPPLFSLLGGWLDFQHAVPVHSLTVWIPLWIALALAVAVERAPAGLATTRAASQATRPSRLAIAHGVSAAIITLFALPHLVNHLAGLAGGDVHIAVMDTLRRGYRHPLVEPVLLAAVAFQIITGAWLLGRVSARSPSWQRAVQTAGGAYLLVFFLSHVSAALRARARGGDPNWNWLAGGELLVDPWSVRLVPYYFLAVVAFGIHAAAGLQTVLRQHGIRIRDGVLVSLAAALASSVALLILIGLFRA